SFVNAQIVINGTSYNGFQKNYTNNTGELYTYSLYDNEVYPAVYNINESIMENTPHGNFTISNSNNYYLVSLIGINTSKTNSFLEAMVSASGNGRVYYCNSSYTTGNIKNNNNCVLFGVFDTSDFNHSHGSHSKHNVFSMPIINGSVGSVKVTSNSSFVFTRESGTVYLGYVNVTSRDDSVKYSNNNGNSWTNLGDLYTVDLHLHQYDNNTEGLKYNVCTVNSTETVCSVSRTDYFNISYLPPTSVNVLLNKESFYYQDILTANRTDSSAFYGDISNYSWYIVDVDFNEIKYINTTNETSINHTLQNLSPGYYYVMVKVTDTNNLSSYSYSDYFYVGSEFLSPCNETLTVNSTGVDVFFNWTTDILSGETFISGVNGTNNLTFTNSTGYLTINNTMYSYYGLYELYMTQYITSDTGCYLDLCKNNWVTNIGKCIDGFQDVTYSDVNACPEEYDKPSDYTQTCTVDASTFNVFFLIIILGLVLLIIGLIWKNNIFIMFGGLLLFLAGVMMLIEPINNLTETMNLIVGVLLFGFGAWIWVTSTLNMIESGNEQDEEEW
ncbi:MAG TPA: hypothetical protein PLT65_04405, partial [Bacilli bacterium]|nr:hypothetical protein [Bacilli bacterium]